MPTVALEEIDRSSKKLLILTLISGTLALLFVCVGIGTPKWESSYVNTSDGSYALSNTANFFYTCSFTKGVFNNCTSRTEYLKGYPRYSISFPWARDYNSHLQSAAGLCTVAILILALSLVVTLVILVHSLFAWTNLASPLLFFITCLLMTAGLAEGSRCLLFNDYSANLYQTGYLLSIFSLFISAFVTGRIHFFRKQEEENLMKTKLIRK
ncbi:unnamed protein product [Adineta ricciae]|uniref:Uncharacterized protein n=1 Tax=Adineta ricciae TaxID=249248 RepID=A0A815D5W0_ADIRI|nr:unnamed protein product [Adineta ricciae]CAF1292666.1 unnamed protein product [Adineta ricciae]